MNLVVFLPTNFIWQNNYELNSEFLQTYFLKKHTTNCTRSLLNFCINFIQKVQLGISWISFVLKRTTNWSRNVLNQFCFKKNHELISEFLDSVLFSKEPRTDLGIPWISFVLGRTMNWSRNFLNHFCFKKNHEIFSEFLESVLFWKHHELFSEFL